MSLVTLHDIVPLTVDLTKQKHDYMKGVSLSDVIVRYDIQNIVDKRREHGYGNKLT